MITSVIPGIMSQQIYGLEEQKKIFDLDAIKENPYLATHYILSIFKNSSKLNLDLFEKNLELLRGKINTIIKNKYLYQDEYIILSSIYGAFLADAMGSATEFRTKSKDNHYDIYSEEGVFKPGQITDDSEMAMSQAFAILDTYNYKTLNPNLLFYYYGIWYASDPLDIGTTTSSALSLLDLTKVNIDDPNIFSEKIKSKIASKNSASLANGFLMRASPLLCWFYMVNKKYVKETLETKSSEKYLQLYIKIRQEMSKDTQITHPNPELPISGSLMIFMGLCAMQQKYSGQEIIEMALLLLNNDYFIYNEIEYKIKNSFEGLVNEIKKPSFSKDDFFGNTFNQMGYYMHAFNLTIYYLCVFDQQKETMSLKDIYNNIMFDISDFGGDTDTNGAIVGMVMGPLIGMENFDRKYFDVFLNFYSRERIPYTNVFMYFYALYLKKIVNENINIKNDIYKVNYNVIELLIQMLNTEMNWLR
jgi:ADP-ribosylglycohydrolase